MPRPWWRVLVGRGMDRPRGSSVALAEGQEVASLRDTIAELDGHADEWWASGVFDDDHRHSRNWICSVAAVVDVDWYDATGEHAHVPEHVAEMLESSAMDAAESEGEREGGMPGSIFHLSPRGCRFVFAIDDPIFELADAKRVAQGAAEFVGLWLEQRKVLGYYGGLRLDRASGSPVQQWRGPRDARVIAMRERLYPAPWLAAYAPPPPAMPVVHRRTVGASAELEEAKERYNTDASTDWPRAGGRCPACGHDGCFGRLDGDPRRWACFSTAHGADSGGCGVEGPTCWHGDALDLALRSAGMSPRDLAAFLRREGYLRG